MAGTTPGRYSMNETPASQPNSQPDATGARSGRRRFWAGFALSFLLLSTLSCGALGLALGVDTAALREIPRAAVWTPPPITLTAEPEPASAENEPALPGVASTFRAGDMARNLTGSRVNVRATAGYQGKPDGDILLQIQPGDRVEILGESAPADGLIWWRIRYTAPDGRVLEGWVAEATASGVKILAPVP